MFEDVSVFDIYIPLKNKNYKKYILFEKWITFFNQFFFQW